MENVPKLLNIFILLHLILPTIIEIELFSYIKLNIINKSTECKHISLQLKTHYKIPTENSLQILRNNALV